MFKVNYKTPERRQWPRSDAFIVNFNHISCLFLVFLLFILNMYFFAGTYLSNFQYIICVAFSKTINIFFHSLWLYS